LLLTVRRAQSDNARVEVPYDAGQLAQVSGRRADRRRKFHEQRRRRLSQSAGGGGADERIVVRNGSWSVG